MCSGSVLPFLLHLCSDARDFPLVPQSYFPGLSKTPVFSESLVFFHSSSLDYVCFIPPVSFVELSTQLFKFFTFIWTMCMCTLAY